MSSGISNRRAEEAEITRLFRELAQMEPVEIDLQVFSDDQTRQLVGLLRLVLGHINEHLE